MKEQPAEGPEGGTTARDDRAEQLPPPVDSPVCRRPRCAPGEFVESQYVHRRSRGGEVDEEDDVPKYGSLVMTLAVLCFLASDVSENVVCFVSSSSVVPPSPKKG